MMNLFGIPALDQKFKAVALTVWVSSEELRQACCFADDPTGYASYQMLSPKLQFFLGTGKTTRSRSSGLI